ncbi:MAG: trigger factor [Lachnospiraceae bacterium]
MKKRIMALVVSACIMVSMVGCGAKEISNEYITISQYKGVEVEQIEETKVTDATVEASIKNVLESNTTSKEITDRAVQKGDVATIDYTGTKDGVAFEGGSAADFPLTIGSGSFIEGFEEGIIGHSIGETFDLPLTFPGDYQNQELAGAAVVFSVTVKSIAEQTVPELTDEFVKKVSEKSKTVESYKKEVKKELNKSNKDATKSSLAEAAWTVVVDNTKVKKYPDKKVEASTKKLQEQYKQMASYYNMEFADFLQQKMGMTEADFDTQVVEAAKSSVKQDEITNLIAKKARIKLSDKEYNKEFKSLAKQYGYEDVDALKKAADEDMLKGMVLQTRVKAWIADNAIQVEAKKETKTETKKETKKETKTETKDATNDNTEEKTAE